MRQVFMLKTCKKYVKKILMSCEIYVLKLQIKCSHNKSKARSFYNTNGNNIYSLCFVNYCIPQNDIEERFYFRTLQLFKKEGILYLKLAKKIIYTRCIYLLISFIDITYTSTFSSEIFHKTIIYSNCSLCISL